MFSVFYLRCMQSKLPYKQRSALDLAAVVKCMHEIGSSSLKGNAATKDISFNALLWDERLR